jgi:hypothetical protein
MTRTEVWYSPGCLLSSRQEELKFFSFPKDPEQGMAVLIHGVMALLLDPMKKLSLAYVRIQFIQRNPKI